MKRKHTLEHVGDITVDAGIIRVGDPCYSFKNHDKWLKWLAINKLDSNDCPDTNVIGTDRYERYEGKAGDAVVVQSGYGDGVYPVFVERDADGTIARLVVDFTLED